MSYIHVLSVLVAVNCAISILVIDRYLIKQNVAQRIRNKISKMLGGFSLFTLAIVGWIVVFYR